jgi:hydroxymethylpyrimidine pyrophosphatase-like HAD family hydrolase
VTHSERDRLLLEISAPGVDKGTALARLAADRKIASANVAAVGDMMNDLPMLQWASNAYAVANAHPQLFTVAKAIPSNDDDGVALLLEAITRRISHP